MTEFFQASPLLAWSLVSSMLALLAVSLLWSRIRWWWHNTAYSLPLLGGITRLSRDTNRDSSDKAWFKAEKALCRDYKKFIRIQDEHDFNEKISYLTKAGDNGRRDTPNLIWLLTVALVFVEAMGFSYVLAGYTLPGASENLQQMGAYGIAFLISVILVAFTHFAGHELYRSGKIKEARQDWVESGREGKTRTENIALARPQSVDDAQPGYVQLMNRVGTQPGYAISIGTAIFVVIVAIGATYVRGQVLEKQLHQQTTGQAGGAGVELAVKAGADGLDMSAKESKIQLPAADSVENQRAVDKARDDDVSIDRHGGWGTFIVLAFIFVFLQILGVLFGYRWGFAGRESRAAFLAIGAGRYTSYADVREHYKEIADTAQSKLEHLQQRLMNRNSLSGNDGAHTTKTFYDFMEAERRRETEERGRELERAQQGQRMKAPAPQAAGASSVKVASVDSVLQQLDELGQDKEAKKALIQTLPDALRDQVQAELKRRKEDEQARRVNQRDAELDGLL
ncbi:hypothetical protein [Paucibacter sp. B51]|uniref:hypothetical protein n=1 Tax=Paucibacter sp. B51 TaxID=2993315 RepID=UPI0022EBBCFB|nr:hypothetical protein [Paucibacter sp. B51]